MYQKNVKMINPMKIIFLINIFTGIFFTGYTQTLEEIEAQFIKDSTFSFYVLVDTNRYHNDIYRHIGFDQGGVKSNSIFIIDKKWKRKKITALLKKLLRFRKKYLKYYRRDLSLRKEDISEMIEKEIEFIEVQTNLDNKIFRKILDCETIGTFTLNKMGLKRIRPKVYHIKVVNMMPVF